MGNSGFTFTPDNGHGGTDLSYEDPGDEETDVGPARLQLTSDAEVNGLTALGGGFQGRKWLGVWTDFRDPHLAWRNYGRPFANLLTMILGKDAPIVDCRMFQNGTPGQWVTMLSPEMKPSSSERPDYALVQYTRGGVDLFGAWLEVHARFEPLVSVIAAVLTDRGRAIENQVLELTTAAEGLHRRMYPEARRLSQADVEETLLALENAPLSTDARRILADALRIYLWAPSFKARLAGMAADVSGVSPGLTGRTNRWTQAVTEARNGFAHHLVNGKESSTIGYYYALRTSLLFTLIIELLLQAGLDPDGLKEDVKTFRPLNQFLQQAGEWAPRIYAAPVQSN